MRVRIVSILLLALGACGEPSAPPVSPAPPPLDVDLVLEWPVYRAVAADATGTAKVVYRNDKTGLSGVVTGAHRLERRADRTFRYAWREDAPYSDGEWHELVGSWRPTREGDESRFELLTGGDPQRIKLQSGEETLPSLDWVGGSIVLPDSGTHSTPFNLAPAQWIVSVIDFRSGRFTDGIEFVPDPPRAPSPRR